MHSEIAATSAAHRCGPSPWGITVGSGRKKRPNIAHLIEVGPAGASRRFCPAPAVGTDPLCSRWCPQTPIAGPAQLAVFSVPEIPTSCGRWKTRLCGFLGSRCARAFPPFWVDQALPLPTRFPFMIILLCLWINLDHQFYVISIN